MRYMMMIKATRDSEAGVPPNPELVAAVGTFAQELMNSGVVVATGGLQPSSTGTRIQFLGGKRTVIDGPFSEAKELIGGFAIVEAKSKEDAFAVANRFVDLHVKFGIDGEVEIRPMFDGAGCDPSNHS